MRIYHGVVYYNGKVYSTLRDALLDAWKKRKGVIS